MTIAALARGGSGDYVYNWAAYSMTRMNDGIREIGRGKSHTVEGVDGRAVASSIEIDNGSYVILLNVQDNSRAHLNISNNRFFLIHFSATRIRATHFWQ